ncbi:MAG: TniB family NTP-binding protein [Cypionkella sp.]|uniref:TniB family NTP-binding protein n=1 Tax=Cypionkella sp. TaxID=2811411 RepID=UPI002ABAA45E|nr:TniB family NTP-binding protein [Cypionkella sp.]MDZ4309796.1 TniB family NTP-binding protein [Cypionkella sp.]
MASSVGVMFPRAESELEVRALNHLRDMDLRMIMIDEVHNLLAGSYREQRRFLNMFRFLANDLCASLVVFGVNEVVDAIRGDEQLARRLDEHFLPLWEDDVEFSRLIQTLIAAMPLKRGSGLGDSKIAPDDQGLTRLHNIISSVGSGPDLRQSRGQY